MQVSVSWDNWGQNQLGQQPLAIVSFTAIDSRIAYDPILGRKPTVQSTASFDSTGKQSSITLVFIWTTVFCRLQINFHYWWVQYFTVTLTLLLLIPGPGVLPEVGGLCFNDEQQEYQVLVEMHYFVPWINYRGLTKGIRMSLLTIYNILLI